MRPSENTTIRKRKPPYRRLPLLIALMTTTALGIGGLTLHYLETRLVATTGKSLALLATDITVLLDQVLFERYSDVQLMTDVFPGMMQDASALTHYLNRMKERYLLYRWMGVTDAAGRIVAATDPASVGQDRSDAAWFQAVRDGKAVYLRDVSVYTETGWNPMVGFSAPVRGAKGEFLGVVTTIVGLSELESTIGRTVFAFQSQHGNTGRVEWQFLARDGTLIADSMLGEEGTVNLRQLGLPSAQLSETDETGFLEEQHARRLVPVVTGYARTQGYGEFPGFQWRMLVRMDREDILAPIHATLWKLALAGTVVWVPLLGLLLWMTRRLRVGWATAQERGEQLAATLTSIGDAVIVTDERGRVTFINPVAQALTGWTQDEADGQDLGAVFTIVNNATRHPVESPVTTVLREGVIVGLANHTLLIARDGAEHPIDDSGAPIRDGAGRLRGVVLVFRDISTRKSMEATLRNRTEAFKGLMEAAQRITTEWDIAQTLRYIVETAARLSGAKYGALGIFEETGERLTDFIAVGIDEETTRAIGTPPTGRGLLGLLTHKEEVLRLKDLGQHPASVGFPPGHPPMRTFLGVSIRAHGRLFGRLYLTEKEGAGEFTDVDAEVVSALAAEAGTAIENAHLLAAARAAEANHRLLLESTGEGIYGLDQDGLCTFINTAGAVMLGYQPEEILGKNMHELIHHTKQDGSPYPLGACPILRACRTEPHCRLDDEVLWRRDGSSFPAEYAAHPVLNKDRITGAVITFTDITARKQTEQTFRSLVEGTAGTVGESFFRSLVQHLAAVLNVRYALVAEYTNEARDRARTIAVWSGTGLLDNFEYSLAGAPCEGLLEAHQWFYPRDLRRQFPSMEMLATLEAESYLGISLRDAAGRALGLLVVMDTAPMIESELPQTLMKIFGARAAAELERGHAEKALRDSEAKLRQAQKMEAVGQLAGGIAHDFNNLLMVINGYSALLLRDLGPDSPLRRYPLEIKKAGDRAAALTQQLLTFSRRQTITPSMLHLNKTVASVQDMLRRLIGEHIELVVTPAPHLDCVVADQSQVEQIIINLVINARDAMPNGGRLAIETANVVLDEAMADSLSGVAPGPYVMLTVRDTGHGMDAATQARIFEPFFTTKEPGKGTGLGLASVFGIVKQSGGAIAVQSEPGHGSAFQVYLPRAAGGAVEPQPAGTAEQSPGGLETILLVEDQEEVRTLVQEILQQAGYHVLVAHDGIEALTLSERHKEPIHLLLTDVVMPKMSGRQVADRLAPTRPAMKVLYLSGYTDDALGTHGALDPGTSLLLKPFEADVLLRKLRELLDAGPR